jgi:hypothetical protein
MRIKRQAGPTKQPHVEEVVSQSLVVYRIGWGTLANANAADAAGVVKYIKDDPMGYISKNVSSELHAFRVVWTSSVYDVRSFECAYKECNGGKCVVSHLTKDNPLKSTLCAFGTLNLKQGGRWFSFEESNICSESVTDHLPCFTYEVLCAPALTSKPVWRKSCTPDEIVISLGVDVIKQVKEAGWEDAGKLVQQSFGGPVADAISEGAIDQTDIEPPVTFKVPQVMQGQIKAAQARWAKQKKKRRNDSDSEDSDSE